MPTNYLIDNQLNINHKHITGVRLRYTVCPFLLYHHVLLYTSCKYCLCIVWYQAIITSNIHVTTTGTIEWWYTVKLYTGMMS